jgi:hypothetical protein
MKERLYDRVRNKSLDSGVAELALERTKNFTYSNTHKRIGEREEVERYRTIVNYFWLNARARLRENETNLGYFDEINHRLAEIGGTNRSLRKLCSKLIYKIFKSKLGQK